MGVAHSEGEGRRLAVLALLPRAACAPYADAGRYFAAGGRGLAKLNAAPQLAYERVLAPKDAPGPFAPEQLYPRADYPRIDEIAGYGASGEEDPPRHRTDLRGALFSTTTTVQKLAP